MGLGEREGPGDGGPAGVGITAHGLGVGAHDGRVQRRRIVTVDCTGLTESGHVTPDRRQLGLVSQTPFLFSASVGDNIRYGRPEAGDAEVHQAALGISGGDWLADLPRGLDTDVGERGANLSLGQRQLVALARVLLKDPAIFILDEATASVDPFTEAQIQEGLDMVMRHRTSIVIAHRLSTIKNADRIIVMEHGRIVEEGNHASLLAQSGHYAELYNTYFRHQSLEYINSGVALEVDL